MPSYHDFKSEAAVGAELANPALLMINEDAFLANRNMQTHKMESYQDGRTRKRGSFRTTDLDSFTGYVELNADPKHVQIFINQDQMCAIAILNFNAELFEQGHLDHEAQLEAQHTVTFKKLLVMHGQGRCNQKSFAEFLEDWGHQVIAKDSDGATIDTAKAVNAVRNMRIDASSQTDSSVSNLRESRSSLASVEAKSVAGALPSYFEVIDNCYDGLPEHLLKLRLGVGQNDDKPVFKLDIIGLQIIKDNLAKEFAIIVKDSFNGVCDVLLGEFER